MFLEYVIVGELAVIPLSPAQFQSTVTILEVVRAAGEKVPSQKTPSKIAIKNNHKYCLTAVQALQSDLEIKLNLFSPNISELEKMHSEKKSFVSLVEKVTDLQSSTAHF